MLHELEVLEAGRIADLALDVRRVRDRLLEQVPDADLGEPEPTRGEHNPSSNLGLTPALQTQPEFRALQQAIAALPRAIREKLWAVARTGRGDATAREWDDSLSAATILSDDDIAADLTEEPDLHEFLRKGLYELRATRLPDDAH
jgi:hypothetical protein